MRNRLNKFAKLVITGCVGTFVSIQASATDLLDIYKDAYQHDATIAQAKANRDYYLAGVDAATAALLPQIDVVGTLGATVTDTKPSGYDANNREATAALTLSQALWRHSNWINRTIAEKNAIKYDLAYQDALQNLIIRVSQAYFNVLRAADVLEYVKANNEAVRLQLDEANRQFQVGVIAETDRLEAQASYDLSNAQVISAQNSLENSYEAIRALTGHSVTIDELAKLDLGKFSTAAVGQMLASLIKAAEENNLDLQQRTIERDVAQDNIRLAQSGHEPTLDLSASAQTGYTRYNHQTSSQSTGNNWAATVGLSLNIPLYHGGATVAAVDQAEAQYVSASQALELAHRNLITKVTNDFNDVNAAISSVQAYNQSVTSAQAALNATRVGYDVGTRTITDVLNATQNLYNAMQNASGSRFDYIISRLDLLYADGSLKLEHMEAVNDALEDNK